MPRNPHYQVISRPLLCKIVEFLPHGELSPRHEVKTQLDHPIDADILMNPRVSPSDHIIPEVLLENLRDYFVARAPCGSLRSRLDIRLAYPLQVCPDFPPAQSKRDQSERESGGDRNPDDPPPQPSTPTPDSPPMLAVSHVNRIVIAHNPDGKTMIVTLEPSPVSP